MFWKGKFLINYGDLYEAAHAIFEDRDEDDAEDFMAQYREYMEEIGQPPSTADSNIGFLAGDMSSDDAAEWLMFFDVEHPVLGNAEDMINMTPEKAFKAGATMMEQETWSDCGRPLHGYHSFRGRDARRLICRYCDGTAE